MKLDEIIIAILPLLFPFILGFLAGLPPFYYALRKLIKDWEKAKADGDISESEFDLLIKDFIEIINQTSNAYKWFIDLLKQLKG